jgi:hypothetical protein
MSYLELSKQLRAIDKLCLNITKRAIENIAPQLSNCQSEILMDLMFACPDATDTQIGEVCQETFVDLVTYPKNIKQEIPNFLVSSGDTFTINDKGCPELHSVWCGDAYGVPNLDGLKALYTDLKKHYDDLETNTFIEICKHQLAMNPSHQH